MPDELETDRDPWHDRDKGMLCRTCRFYVKKGARDDTTKEIGRCRRYAPVMAGFPVVFPHDWCGEHKLDENRV